MRPERGPPMQDLQVAREALPCDSEEMDEVPNGATVLRGVRHREPSSFLLRVGFALGEVTRGHPFILATCSCVSVRRPYHSRFSDIRTRLFPSDGGAPLLQSACQPTSEGHQHILLWA